MLSKFIQRVLGRSDIHFNGSLYMRRWRIIHTPWFGIRIHNIVRSDDDRELHDHPFSFVSFILKGGYNEYTPRGGPDWYGPGSVIFRRAEDLHRLELRRKRGFNLGGAIRVPDQTSPEVSAWTFVIRGPTRRQWGFMTDKGWVSAKDFVGSREGVTAGTTVSPMGLIHDNYSEVLAEKIDLKKLLREVMESYEFSPFVPISVDGPEMKRWGGEVPNPDFVDVKPIPRDGKD